jgi:hypothetical protein
VWTRTAFSEYASAAAFAEIASALAAAGAPLDFIAAAGDFVVEETVHAEYAARLAALLGGAVPLEVDLERLVRPPESSTPLLRAAELLVRTSSVGETLTVPVLKRAAAASSSALVRGLLTLVAADESAHAELGPWFLDWAAAALSDRDREHLGRVAGRAIRAFAPIFGGTCVPPGPGVLGCDDYDETVVLALERRVLRRLAARGIEVPGEDVAAVTAVA